MSNTDAQQVFIAADLAAVEPVLRARATNEIDTRGPAEVAGRSAGIALTGSRR